ncbi:MAG TPA: alpha/beta hydrolase [Egibacteraceae bacterium]|nr:alpha/beta hydrolase [Egibacteraceae bacterium]
MTDDRIHRAISADGTEIAGRVHGQGPPLVLFHGLLEDGDTCWEALVPHLTDRFTCYRPSSRGVGLSGDNPDHAPPRHWEDAVAFVDSIDAPVFLMGESDGATQALHAAAEAAAVVAVAVYEPFVGSVMRENDLARLGAVVEQTAEAAADGRLADAARTFTRAVATEDEIAALEATDFFEHNSRYVPVLLQDLQASMAYEGPQPTDPSELAKIAAPVLLLRGQQTLHGTFFADSEQHVAQHVADPHVREPLLRVGHWAPSIAPEPIAKELISFFESVRRPEPG